MSPNVTEMLRVLWGYGEPMGCRVVHPGSVGQEQQIERLLVLPRPPSGRYIVSDAGPQVTPRLVTGHNGIRKPRRAWQRRAVAAAIRMGPGVNLVAARLSVLAPVSKEPLTEVSFPAHLRHLLDVPEALLALGVREIDWHHSKPTLQVHHPTGVSLGYAKLGWSAATAALVEHEARALERLRRRGPLPGVTAPSLLHSGSWSDHPYLVVEPLPADIRKIPNREVPYAAARAISGPATRCLVTESPWWHELVRRADALPGRSTLTQAANNAVVRLQELCRGHRWDFGAWHGDWVRWNVGRSGGLIHAWDWEHASDCAPLGFDDLHWSISHDQKVAGLSMAEALDRAARHVPLPAGVDPHLLLEAYLAEMAVRSCEVSAPTGEEPIGLHDGLGDALEARRTATR